MKLYIASFCCIFLAVLLSTFFVRKGHSVLTPINIDSNTTTQNKPSPSSATTIMPLSAAEYRLFNRLADEMTFYHDRFRSSWNDLYAGCAPNARVPGPSRLITMGMQFCQHLQGHHDIEEMYWFPYLAKNMEGFRPGKFAKQQHKEIHKGLDVLGGYLLACKSGEQEFQREELRRIMDSFGGVLWKHLDEEIVELGAENMKKHWTEKEMKNFPF